MKKLLLLTFVISTMFAVSQTTTNFVDSKATWNVARTFPNATPEHPSFVETTTKVFGFVGDTTIEGNTWLKLCSTPDSNFTSDFTYLGSLREEGGYVYFIDTLSIMDTLYNFDLQVGDSVFYNFPWDSDYIKVEAIDSIEIEGEYRKRFFMEEPSYLPMYMREVWIEGIGSVHGPLYPKYPQNFLLEMPDSLNLTCYKVDNAIVWNSPFYDDCYINHVLSSNEIEKGKLKLYPNPVTDRLKIEMPRNKSVDCKVSIFDLVGKRQITHFFNRNESIEIDVSPLNKGFYLIEIVFENQKYRQRLVKEDF